MTKFLEKRSENRGIDEDKNIIVFYHVNCSDGFCSAWVAWKKFGASASYVAAEPSDRAPQINGKTIYMLDTGFAPEELKILAENNKIIMIDHHISRKDIVSIAQEHIFDINHSGCALSWNYFFPDDTVPKLLLHVEDFDLLKFNIPHTKELIASLDIYDFNFEIYDKIAEDLEDEQLRGQYIKRGQAIVEYEDKQVERIINNNGELVEFEGYKTMAVNCPLLHSQIGAKIRDTFPPISIVWYHKDGHTCVSLRSDGTVDVAKIAEKYGGGGHVRSSGFNVASDYTFPWKIIKE